MQVRRGRGGICTASLKNMLGRAPNRETPDLMIDSGNRFLPYIPGVYHFHSATRREYRPSPFS